MPDLPFQRVPGDLQRPGGVAGRELAEGRPVIMHAKVTQRPGADPFEHRLQQALVEGARPVGRAIQPFAQPIVYGLAQGVGARGLDSRVQFLVPPWSLARTSCLVLPETFRQMRFPSGPWPSEIAPMYRFFAASR